MGGVGVIESGLKWSVLIMPNQHTRVTRQQTGDFLWLLESSQQHRRDENHPPIVVDSRARVGYSFRKSRISQSVL